MAFNTSSSTQPPGRGFTPAQFIIAAVVLTALIIAGIKYFISPGRSPEGSSQQAADPFKAGGGESRQQDRNYNPAARPESLSSGGSIDMFRETNAGFSGEEADASTAAAKTSADELSSPAGKELKNQAGAAKSGAAAPAAPKPAGTVIPRLKPVSGFGASSSGRQGMPAGMKGMSGATPDVSAIVNNAMKQSSDKVKSGKKP